MTEVPSSTVSDDLACIHCGYNLRGLAYDGKCPECSKPVSTSRRGDFLKHADPEWLNKVRFGCALKLWNIVFGILLGVVGGILVTLGFPVLTLHIIGLAGSAFGLWASFAITTQEPRISLQEDPFTWRRAIRVCATAAFLASAIPDDKVRAAGVIAFAVVTVMKFSGIVSLFGELVYFRRFAERVPDPKLAKSTKIVQWGATITFGLVLLLGILFVAFGPGMRGTANVSVTGTRGSGSTVTTTATPSASAPTPAPTGAPPSAPSGIAAVTTLWMFPCVFGLAGLVFGIWYLLILMRYRRVFAKAADEARALATGAADTPPET